MARVVLAKTNTSVACATTINEHINIRKNERQPKEVKDLMVFVQRVRVKVSKEVVSVPRTLHEKTIY